VLSLLKLTVKL